MNISSFTTLKTPSDVVRSTQNCFGKISKASDAAQLRAPRHGGIRAMLVAFGSTAVAASAFSALAPATAHAAYVIGESEDLTLDVKSDGSYYISNSNAAAVSGNPTFTRFDEFSFNSPNSAGKIIIAQGAQLIFDAPNDRLDFGTGMRAQIELEEDSSLTFSGRRGSNIIGGALSFESEEVTLQGGMRQLSNGGYQTFGELNFRDNQLTGSNSGGAAIGAFSNTSGLNNYISYPPRVVFENNSVGGSGGAIHVRSDAVSNAGDQSAISASAQFSVFDALTIRENHAAKFGGAFFVQAAEKASLAVSAGYGGFSQSGDLIIENNYTGTNGNYQNGEGGGAFAVISTAATSGSGQDAPEAKIDIYGFDIVARNNKASKGGLMYSKAVMDAQAKISADTSSLITGNVASQEGGVVYVASDNSTASFDLYNANAIISNNSASVGGVGYIHAAEDASFIIHQGNSLKISGNIAKREGGFAFVKSENGDAYFRLDGRVGGGISSGNKAAQENGASTATGGFAHIESVNEKANLVISTTDGMADSDVFVIRDNVVGTGTNIVKRAIYLSSGRQSGASGQIDLGSPVNAGISNGRIELYDAITAVKNPQNTKGYTVYIGTTFAQIGTDAKVSIPGITNVQLGVHELANGARYQTYEEGAAISGTYNVPTSGIVAVRGSGNVISSQNFGNSPISIYNFIMSDTVLPGSQTAMLTLEGNSTTQFSNAKIGENKVKITGDVAKEGEFFLLDTRTIGSGVDTSISTNFDTSKLTFNGNSFGTIGSGAGERSYGKLSIHSTDVLNSGISGSQLYLKVEKVGGNIQNVYDFDRSTLSPTTNTTLVTWKAGSTAVGATHKWMGGIPDAQGTITSTETSFLNGDLVKFDARQVQEKYDVTVDGDVIVGSLSLNEGELILTAGQNGGNVIGNTKSTRLLPELVSTLSPSVDGTLHVGDPNNSSSGYTSIVTVKTTIDFAGNGTDFGVQLHNKGQLILSDEGKLGFNDDQNIELSGNDSQLNFNRSKPYTYKGVVRGQGNVTVGYEDVTFTKNQKFTGNIQVGGKIILEDVDFDAEVAMITNISGTGRVSKKGYSYLMGEIAPGSTKKPTGKLIFSENSGDVMMNDNSKLVVNVIGKNASSIYGGGDIQLATGTGNGVGLELAEVGGAILLDDTYLIAEANGEITGDFNNANGTVSITNANGSYKFEIEKHDAAGKKVDATNPNPVKSIWLRTVTTAYVGSASGGTSAIPEPSTYALCGGIGALAFAFYRRRRQKHRQSISK